MAERQITQGIAPVAQAGQIPRIQFASGAARLLQRFSQQIFSVGEEIHNQQDQRAAAQGDEAGAVAGQNPDGFQKMDYGTIRGRAFNQAATSSFVTTVETGMISKVMELSRAHAGDPVGLQSALDDYGKGMINEVKKTSPKAAGLVNQQMQTRSLAAVERSRDERFKLTRDHAQASLITNRIAVEAELKTVAGDLFSDNPKRSALASQQIGALHTQLNQVYSATDGDGKPLFDEVERAKASQEFYGMVLENSTLSWFDGQDDKVGAYSKFIDGKFNIEMNSPGISDAGDDIRSFMVPGKHGPAHDGLTPSFRKRFASFMASAPEGIRGGLKLFSGQRSIAQQRELWTGALAKYGSPEAARKWVAPPGKSKHNHGKAGDLSFNGVRLDEADEQVREWVHENAPKHGLNFRLDNEPWHIETDDMFDEMSSSEKVDVRKLLSPAKLAQIEGEMRQRISFSNTIDDRSRAMEDRELRDSQAAEYFQLTDWMASGGDESMGLPDIRRAVESEAISPDMGRAMIGAYKTQSGITTNSSVEKELIGRMFSGENVQVAIFEAKSDLTSDDFKQLLTQNRTLNGGAADTGEFSKNEKFYFDRLKETLATGGLMDAFDPSTETRKMNALIEFQHRVGEDETPEEITRDILSRANRDKITFVSGQFAKMLTPRFSIPDLSMAGRIDINASKTRLKLALKSDAITKAGYDRQVKLLREWEAAQIELDRMKEAE